jgi:hypothetical protein
MLVKPISDRVIFQLKHIVTYPMLPILFFYTKGTNTTANKDPMPNNPSKTYAHYAGSTNNTHDAVDEMQPGMVEDGKFYGLLNSTSPLCTKKMVSVIVSLIISQMVMRISYLRMMKKKMRGYLFAGQGKREAYVCTCYSIS